MNPFQHSESIAIDAPTGAVYELVTDIGRTGEWSPICRECWWQDGQTLRVGASFAGRNEADGRVWETTSRVAVADLNREFAWLVGDSAVRWGYLLEPVDAASTKLTESWEFLPAGLEMFAESRGSDADHQIEVRRQWAVAGIPATLAAIKAIAEAERSH